MNIHEQYMGNCVNLLFGQKSIQELTIGYNEYWQVIFHEKEYQITIQIMDRFKNCCIDGAVFDLQSNKWHSRTFTHEKFLNDAYPIIMEIVEKYINQHIDHEVKKLEELRIRCINNIRGY